MRPFFSSLRFKLLVIVLVALAVTGGIFSYIQYTSHKSQDIRDLEASAIRLGNVIISSIEHHMITQDREAAQRVVETIAGGEKLEKLLILNKLGEVKIASDRNEIGTKLHLNQPTCQLCHRLALEQRPKAVIFTKEAGERVYRLVNPIPNKAQCQGCHEPRVRLLGVQVADFSLEEIEANLAREIKSLLFYLLSVMATISLILWVFMDRTMINKLGRLAKATERISQGDLEARVEVRGKDEVAELADAFNTMTERLQQQTNDLRMGKRKLEELYRISLAMLEPMTLNERLDFILKGAHEVLGLDRINILLPDKEMKMLHSVASVGNIDEPLDRIKVPLDERGGGIALAFKEKREIYWDGSGPVPEGLKLAHPYSEIKAFRSRNFLVLPLVSRGKAIGVIGADNKFSRKAISYNTIEMLRVFASQAAVAIENARLFERELKRSQELAGLIKVGQMVSSSLSLEDVLEDVVFLAAQVMDVSTCALMLLDEKGEELICRAQIGLPEEWVRDERHRVGVGLSGFVALEGKALSIIDMASDPRYVHQDMARRYSFVSYLGVPIKARERLLGVLSVLTKKPRPFTEDEIGLLSTFADQAGIAIENARLFETELRLLKEAQERKRLEDISRIRSEFIANVSHELRTPLNSITGFSEVILDQKFGELNERQARYVNNILISGKHLLDVINGLIDISKVDSGKIELKPEEFLLREVLETSLAIIRPQAERKELILRLDFDSQLSTIRADPVRFKQIMYNLLSNAVKFTPDGGEVRVTAQLVRSPMSDVRSQVTQGLSPELRTTAHLVHGSQFTVDGKGEEIREPSAVNRERDFVKISVSDTGIGIKPEDQAKLFKEFSQIDSTYAKKHQGAGLGLSLTKRLVELHGGRIWVESEGEGRGTTFTFTLPLAQDAP